VVSCFGAYRGGVSLTTGERGASPLAGRSRQPRLCFVPQRVQAREIQVAKVQRPFARQLLDQPEAAPELRVRATQRLLGIELRFFERDQNKDMIQGYLKDGQFESIPVFVFYDKNHRELAHFIERPALANEQIHVTREIIGNVSPEALAAKLGHEPSEEEIAHARAESRARYMEWQKTSDTWAGWRVATVDEVIGKLEAATA